jgi:hypothetical protein
MSKLRTTLRTLGRSAATTIGFSPTGDRGAARQVLVAAQVTDAASAGTAVEAGANAIVTTDPAAVAAIAEAMDDDTLTALLIPDATAAAVAAAREAGADLFLFDDAESEAAALLDEEIDAVLLLGDDRSEERLRSIASLPVAAIVVTPPATLTVRDQIALRRVAELTQKPLIAAVDAAPDATTLDVWRNAGVPVVLQRTVGAVAETRAAADAVPPPRRRNEERPTPVIPQVTGNDEHDDID